jgi:hypothetical protein
VELGTQDSSGPRVLMALGAVGEQRVQGRQLGGGHSL